MSSGLWRNLTVGDLLDRNAAVFPDKLAMADESTEVSWKQFRLKVNRMAFHLLKLGIGYGDFFLIQTANVVEFYYLFLRLEPPRRCPGDVLAPAPDAGNRPYAEAARSQRDLRHGRREIRLRRHGRRNAPLHPYLKVKLVAGGDAPAGWLSLDDLLRQEIEKDFPADYLDQLAPDPNDICCEQLSGGSTGVPKSIPRTHNDYMCMWEAYIGLCGFTDESICLVGIPVAHNANFNTMTGPAFLKGGTIILTKSPRPKEQFALIEKYRVTTMQLIPVQITYWMEADEERQEIRFELSAGHQRRRSEGAAGAGQLVPGRARGRYGKPLRHVRRHHYRQPLGQSQRTPDVYHRLSAYPGPRTPGQDSRMRRTSLLNPERWEKWWSKVRAISRAISETPSKISWPSTTRGSFHSGDLMSQRPDGRYVVEGRMGDVIKRAGENVYPAPVEAFWYSTSKWLTPP